MDKEQYIRNMQETLKHYGISGSEYAINKVRDDTVCLVHHDEIAEVFYYNRNTCMRTSEYDSIADFKMIEKDSKYIISTWLGTYIGNI